MSTLTARPQTQLPTGKRNMLTPTVPCPASQPLPLEGNPWSDLCRCGTQRLGLSSHVTQKEPDVTFSVWFLLLVVVFPGAACVAECVGGGVFWG